MKGATDLEDWLDAERRHFRAKGVEALTQQAEILLAQGATDAATALAERALTLDPLSERAARSVMRSRILSGDRRGATECGQQFAERLKTELGVEASAELQHLGKVAEAATPEAERGGSRRRRSGRRSSGARRSSPQLLETWQACTATTPCARSRS